MSCIKKGKVKSFNLKQRGQGKGKGFGYAVIPDLQGDVLIHTDTCFNYDQVNVRFTNTRPPKVGDCVCVSTMEDTDSGYRAVRWSYVVATPTSGE